jgi:hypothetical protein
MKLKIYIIGEIPLPIDNRCENKFYRAQIQLYQLGFIVINPVIRLTRRNFTFEEAKKNNFRDLLFCDAVYVLPCMSLSNKGINLELKWAMDNNLYIFSGEIDVITD